MSPWKRSDCLVNEWVPPEVLNNTHLLCISFALDTLFWLESSIGVAPGLISPWHLGLGPLRCVLWVCRRITCDVLQLSIVSAPCPLFCYQQVSLWKWENNPFVGAGCGTEVALRICKTINSEEIPCYKPMGHWWVIIWPCPQSSLAGTGFKAHTEFVYSTLIRQIFTKTYSRLRGYESKI